MEAVVEQLKGEPWDTFTTKIGDWRRPLFIWAARHLYGLTLSEFGRVVGGMECAADSAALKRFEQRVGEDDSLA